MKRLSKSTAETKELGQNLAKEILEHGDNSSSDGALIIALEGELGAGKTTFVQGFAKGLGVEDNITSPTFVIFRMYSIPKGNHYKKMIHMDSYRLRDSNDLGQIGFRETISDNANIILIEWADRILDALPIERINIHLDHINENERRINIL